MKGKGVPETVKRGSFVNGHESSYKSHGSRKKEEKKRGRSRKKRYSIRRVV